MVAAILAPALLVGCGTASSISDDAPDLTSVSFALDWAPNTNHVGVYVADELGYYEEAGVDVEILPYGSAPVSQLVSAGEADFGIGGQSGVQMARTSGLDIKSVYLITQTDSGRHVVLGDFLVQQWSRDLDGPTYCGYAMR